MSEAASSGLAAGSRPGTGRRSRYTGPPDVAKAAGRVLSTHRLQVRPDFDPDATADLSGYLAVLDVSHLYSEVVHPTRGEPQLGGDPARGSSSASCPTTPGWPTQPQARRGWKCSGLVTYPVALPVWEGAVA